MRVLVWHVHGSWTTAFVQGSHSYVVPVVAGRGPEGRGRARTWDWPDSVLERTPEELGDEPIDVVVLQEPRHEELVRSWLGRHPGRDLPAVWLEHNAPPGPVAAMRHPAADRAELLVVHVTHTNQLYWDTGSTPVRVIEHGVVDPGHRYTGEIPHAAAVINEPGRRGRALGADLLGRFADGAPIDLFGMGVTDTAARLRDRGRAVQGFDDLSQAALHDAMARRRAYLHPVRWTSLGLALIEAMHLGLPVVALATTEVPRAVPAGAGIVSNDVDELVDALRELRTDHEWARAMGKAARRAALDRYGLDRFLADWDRTLLEVAG